MKVLGQRSPRNGEAKPQGKGGDGEGSKGTNQIFVVCWDWTIANTCGCHVLSDVMNSPHNPGEMLNCIQALKFSGGGRWKGDSQIKQ